MEINRIANKKQIFYTYFYNIKLIKRLIVMAEHHKKQFYKNKIYQIHLNAQLKSFP